MLSAGYMERWWGPGWDGSLILSTNARPIPSVTLERNYTDPFKTKWLSWIGPWRASIAMGEAEVARRAGARRALLRGAREFQAAALAGVRPDAHRAVVRRRPALRLGHLHRHGARPRQPGRRTAADRRPARQPDGGLRHAPALALARACRWRSIRSGSARTKRAACRSKFIGQFGLETWGSTRSAAGGCAPNTPIPPAISRAQEPEFNCAYRNADLPAGLCLPRPDHRRTPWTTTAACTRSAAC